jgi:REP element-mobilizing transposase RayT
MARGNAKMAIYNDDEDRHRFLVTLERVVARYRIECHAYCLMSNHYHLVVGTTDPNLSSAIQYLNGKYAQWWNERHARVGHVLQGRFKGQLIQSDRYFVEACRYVVLNPVRAGLVKSVQDWAWSSYRATAGFVPCPQFLTTSTLLGQPTATARRDYRAFISGGVQASEVTAALHSDVPVVGSDDFASAQRAAIVCAHRTEVVWRHRRVGRPSLEELFASITNRPMRNLRIREARDRHHYRVSEIAKHLSLHYGSVSRIATRQAALDDRLATSAPQ